MNETAIELQSLTLTELADKIMQENSVENSQELIELFNWFLSKKHIARVAKLNNLYDNITDQMLNRFSTKPDQFSNDDLINYLKAVQSAIDTTKNSISDMDGPPQIIQNNTQINVNGISMENFDRDARARILEAVNKTLEAAKNIPIDDKNIIESEGFTEK